MDHGISRREFLYGSVAAAARALGVNHTTVMRRIQAFEEQVNLRIFERLRTGYRPTVEGEIFLDAANAIWASERILSGSRCLTPAIVSFVFFSIELFLIISHVFSPGIHSCLNDTS